MSYPNYPNNKLIVNGVDLAETYGLVLIDGYSLGPPSTKTYVVDIPGGNGKLDLTETLLGDTAYDNRKQEFTFYIIDAQTFETNKTNVSNFLHGKAFDYTMTMDPGYTYHGRFSVSSYEHVTSSIGKIGIIKIEIDAAPFKFKAKQDLSINAIGGRSYRFPSGRKRVRPTIETSSLLTVIHNNNMVRLPIGSWEINELFFTQGTNEVYVSSYDIRSLTWHHLKTTDSVTWGEFKTQRLFEWYKSKGLGNVVYDMWSDIDGNTWANMSVLSWADLITISNTPGGIGDIHVKYDWGDL